MRNKGINAWAKELKHNEKFAKEYEGVSTVKGILSKAKSQGFDITERDLKDLDLDAIAGGLVGPDMKIDLSGAFDFSRINVDADHKITTTGDGNQVLDQSKNDISIKK